MDVKTKRIKTNLNLMYGWLMAASVITVPAMVVGLNILPYRSPTIAYIIVVLMPGIVHGILLFGLLSDTLYVKRHTQQALILVAIRMLIAVWCFGTTNGDDDLFFSWFFISGAVWLLGSIWGWGQVRQGKCWLMYRRGEDDELLKNSMPLTNPPQATATAIKQQVSQPSDIPMPSIPPLKTLPSTNNQHTPNPYTAFLQGKMLAQQGKNQEAIAALLIAFRHGSKVMQGYVLKEMEQLGEVDRI